MTNKEKILSAASRLLLQKGVEGLSVRAISQAAGLSTIAIYSHFKGKDGVLDALYVEGFGLVRDAMLSVADIPDAREAAMTSGSLYLDIGCEHEGHYRLIFGETGSAYTPSPEATDAAREAFEVLVAQVVRLFPGDVDAAQAREVALRVWALLHGYVSLRHHVIGQVLGDQQWRAMAMESFRLAIEEIAAGQASS